LGCSCYKWWHEVSLTFMAYVVMMVFGRQITNEPHFSQGMFHFDYRVGDLCPFFLSCMILLGHVSDWNLVFFILLFHRPVDGK
jgi:hypothetical protein